MRTDMDDNPGDRVPGPGQLLREAADVETGRDLAGAAWHAAEHGRRRTVWGVAGGLAAAAAAMAMVLVLGPWGGEGPSPTPTPAPPAGETSGNLAEAPVTLVFDEEQTQLIDIDQDFRPARMTDIVARRWTLGGALAGGLGEAEQVVGATAATRLEFRGGEQPVASLMIEDCGGASGSFVPEATEGWFTIGDLGSNGGLCPAHVQRAEDFWLAALAGGPLRLQVSSDGDILLVTVQPPPGARTSEPDATEGAAPGPPAAGAPLGGDLAIAVPEGWELVHRGSLEEGQFTSCLVPTGSVTDPTVLCEGVEITTGLTARTRPAPSEFFAWDDAGPRCYADPAWRELQPGEPRVTVDLDNPASGTGRSGAFPATWQRWDASCEVDGEVRQFHPESWWIQVSPHAYALATSPGVHDLDMAAMLGGLDADGTATLTTSDAVVRDVAPDRLLLGAFGPEGGPVGGEGAEPTGSSAYAITHRTQCLLHDTEQASGVDLRLVPCGDLVDWLSANLGTEPLVTVVTDGNQLLQMRTLYTP